MVEIYRQSQDTLNHTVPTGVERIQAGLSYPYGDDRRYMQAYNIAQRNGVGLHQYHLVDDRLLPGALKQQLQDNLGARATHKISVTNNDCVVINENTYLNESHVLEMTSTIPGAGMAAFLRPTPPDRHAYVIPVGARICLYSDQLVNEAEQVNTDYLLVREAYGRKAWNPLVPDGANFGRLVNQGGLEEGLKALVASCDVTCGSVRFSAGDAETVFMAKSNVTYKYNCNNLATMGRKHQLEVVASKTITSSSTHAIELLGNYGIGYWIPYVLSHHEQWGMDNAIVKCVLWLLLSENSSMGRAERLQYLGDEEHSLVTPATRELFRRMECPFPIDSRKRQRTHS